ncbi:MAG: 4'-phosphopantetheinyl transferase superfamily protein [Pseudomonadota bacterium]
MSDSFEQTRPVGCDVTARTDNAIRMVDIHPAIVAVLAPILSLPSESDFPVETDAVAASVEKRRHEFFAGRHLARIALARLGIANVAIPRNPDRTPQWPIGVKGSISHNDEFVMVAVTQSSEIAGLGIDLEAEASVDPSLRSLIQSDPCERPIDLTTLFSAKESVFKAVFPLCGEFLGHADVTIINDQLHEVFAANSASYARSARAMRNGTGQVLSMSGLVVTTFLLQHSEFTGA